MSDRCLQNLFLGLPRRRTKSAAKHELNESRILHQLCHSTTAITKRKLLRKKGKGRKIHGNRGEDIFKTEFNGNPRKFQKFYLSSSTWKHFFSTVSDG